MCWLIILCRFHWRGQNCTWLSCWSRSVLICLTTDSQLLVMAAGTTFGRQHVMGRSLWWTMCRDQPLYTVGSSLRSVATAHVGVLLLQQIFAMSFDSKYHTLLHLVSWQLCHCGTQQSMAVLAYLSESWYNVDYVINWYCCSCSHFSHFSNCHNR